MHCQPEDPLHNFGVSFPDNEVRLISNVCASFHEPKTRILLGSTWGPAKEWR
jgi:hypothetical protein